jgi:hypothetical protein
MSKRTEPQLQRCSSSVSRRQVDFAEDRRFVDKTGAMSGPRSGEPAPDFTLTTVDGAPWTLSEHLAGSEGDGDVVLVFLRGFF